MDRLVVILLGRWLRSTFFLRKLISKFWCRRLISKFRLGNYDEEITVDLHSGISISRFLDKEIMMRRLAFILQWRRFVLNVLDNKNIVKKLVIILQWTRFHSFIFFFFWKALLWLYVWGLCVSFGEYSKFVSCVIGMAGISERSTFHGCFACEWFYVELESPLCFYIGASNSRWW